MDGRTNEVGYEEKDVLLVRLLGGEVDGHLCVHDIDGASPPHNIVGHDGGSVWGVDKRERAAQRTASRLS